MRALMRPHTELDNAAVLVYLGEHYYMLLHIGLVVQCWIFIPLTV